MNSKELIITFIKTSCAVNDMLAQNLKPFGISLQQFNVLRILRGQNGVPANLSTVQELMVNKMSNTTRIIDKLIDKNFVDRDICKENRRKIELFITKDGLSILKNNTIRYLNDSNFRISNNVSDILVISKNEKWISTFNNGIYHILDTIIYNYNTDNSILKSNTILTINKGKGGDIWFFI